MSRASDDDSLHLLPEWQPPPSPARRLEIILASIGIQIIAVLILLALPSTPTQHFPPEIISNLRNVVPLIAPKKTEPKKPDITQKAPNPEKIIRPLDANNAERFSPPKTKVFRPSAPIQPVTQHQATVAEAPQIQTPVQAPGSVIQGLSPTISPPLTQPKIVMETVGGNGKTGPLPEHPIIPSAQSIAELPRSPIRNSPPSSSGDSLAGATANAPQLLSDPQGADFAPYMLRLRTAVVQNWKRMVPESALLGIYRGTVVVQFIIDRSGRVPKIVIADGSGTKPLDEAAVAGVTGAVPLPRFPEGFKGDEIRVQMAFSYNIPKSR